MPRFISRFELSTRVLTGRLLTRSGDQAWDFAVPIVLLQLMPGQLRIAALYYFLIRVATALFLPRLTMLIDRRDRFYAAKLGISLQLAGVIAGFASVIALPSSVPDHFRSAHFILVFAALVFGGIVAQLGSSFMDISIANDLVPSTFEGAELTTFNSRLRQIDLATEVGAPIVTGFLLLASTTNFPLLGFGIVALWNVLSFFPELGILKSIFNERPELKNKPIKLDLAKTTSVFAKIRDGWKSFFREPIAPVMLAYAILWLSVLSPHGVLLTAFLKDGWHLPEWSIGLVRGLGAMFGLSATVLFPVILKKCSLPRTSFLFLLFQLIAVTVGFGFFLAGGLLGQIGFLTCILFSRIGLYGFSLGEMQIRQTEISPESRGQVNGFASALTALATIGLYGAGMALPSTDDFKVLVLSSVVFVAIALLVYSSRSMSRKT